jgi:raffinose/stachyose/melibiose transport system permease protein
MKARTIRKYTVSIVAIAASIIIFIVPFLFIILNAFKSKVESNTLDFTFPTEWHIWDNVEAVVSAREYMLVTAFVNSTVITVASVAILVILAAMVAFVAERRRTKWTKVIDFIILSGLIIPPAVVPTIWVMQGIGIFKTIPGIILIEVAFGMSFCVLLFRAFISSIPRELDEAAIIDGAGSIRLFFQVVFPLLRSVIITVIVVQSVVIFNDFTNPLYFLPGDENATVQLTLFNFQSQFNTSYNLLFMDILLITIPPLVMFLFFNRQIVAGMSAGAVKG